MVAGILSAKFRKLRRVISRSKLKNKPREVVVLTLFATAVTELLWLPLGFILGFDFNQWVIWLTGSIPYDMLFGYVSAKLIIKFNEVARAKNWY